MRAARLAAEAAGAASGLTVRSDRSSGSVLVDVVGGVLDGADLLGILVGDLRPEFLFETHDQLDEVERVGVEIVDERSLGLDLVLFDAQLLNDDLLQTIVRIP